MPQPQLLRQLVLLAQLRLAVPITYSCASKARDVMARLPLSCLLLENGCT
ncbi:MAG: hypothetical protein GPOALKHO_001440 [Sodalis sp.]|nr:MAG: hypothetical protein GPOALKHO_001440 [Sodalis sp.]